MKILSSVLLLFALVLSVIQATSDTWINALMEKYDKDGDDHINWGEYKHIITDNLKMRLTRTQWRMVSKTFRSNTGTDGMLDRSEILKML